MSITVHALVDVTVLCDGLVAGFGSLTDTDEQTHIEINSQAHDWLYVLLLPISDFTYHSKDNS